MPGSGQIVERSFRQQVVDYAKELCQRGVNIKVIIAVVYALLVVAPYVAEALFSPDKENDFDGATTDDIVEGVFFALSAFVANYPGVLYFLWDFYEHKMLRLRNGELTLSEKVGLTAGSGLALFSSLAGITVTKDSLTKTMGDKAVWVVIIPFVFHSFFTRTFGISALVSPSSRAVAPSESRARKILVKIGQVTLIVTVAGLLPAWMQLVHNGLLPKLNPMAATWVGGIVNETFYEMNAWLFIPYLLNYIDQLVRKGYNTVSIFLLVGSILGVAAMSGTGFMNVTKHQCVEKDFAEVIEDSIFAGEYNPYRVYWDTLIKPWLPIVAWIGAGLSNAVGMLGLSLFLMIDNSAIVVDRQDNPDEHTALLARPSDGDDSDDLVVNMPDDVQVALLGKFDAVAENQGSVYLVDRRRMPRLNIQAGSSPASPPALVSAPPSGRQQSSRATPATPAFFATPSPAQERAPDEHLSPAQQRAPDEHLPPSPT